MSRVLTVPVDLPSWPSVIRLPSLQQEVAEFEYDLLAESLRPFVQDVAERFQCPADYIAAPVIVAVGSLLGRKVQIAPKEFDNWRVVPNLWGGIVGNPGVMKSPAMAEALRPLREMEKAAAQEFEERSEEFQLAEMTWEANKKAIQTKMNDAAKKRGDVQALAEEILATQPTVPTCLRYISSDPTTEKLGELLNENPNGLLIDRDELTGFLRSMDKAGRESDRAFYLEAWNGDSAFTWDRIKRGTVRIESACVSCVGGIQPGPLLQYQREALAGGKGDDGLLQRFQLVVWPDVSRTFSNIDRVPDHAAYEHYESLCTWIATLEGETVVHFTQDAQQVFNVWREQLEFRLRNEELPPAFESHLAKYRSLIPAIALIDHLASREISDVPKESLIRAIAWSRYLESHAQRVYSSQIRRDVQAAHLLLGKIKAGKIQNRFTLREVYRKEWSGLTSASEAKAAAEILLDHHILSECVQETAGRSRVEYLINPEVFNEPA